MPLSPRSALAAALVLSASAPAVQAAMPLADALHEKPVLSTLLGTDARVAAAVDALQLDDAQARALSLAVEDEKILMGALATDAAPRAALDRAARLGEMPPGTVEAFNAHALALAEGSADALSRILGEDGLDAFLAWGEPLWQADSQLGGADRISTALTYEVFCTQYDAYTTYEVAVPDKYVKFAAQGTQYHSGYPADGDYRVTLDRDGSTYTVRVYEVGPWNIDDNYWNAANDPERPRRLYTDLPQGMPEAQAAYYDGYNGGKDQYGRTVLNPGGCDLSIQVAADIGLAYLENDWLKVTYLWEGSGSTSTGNLKGFVREGDIYEGAPVSARVTLSNGASTTTDANGLYTFSGIPAGNYTVTATADCYYPGTVSKTVAAGVDTWASIALEPNPNCGGGGTGGCSMRAPEPLGDGMADRADVVGALGLLAAMRWRRQRRGDAGR